VSGDNDRLNHAFIAQDDGVEDFIIIIIIHERGKTPMGCGVRHEVRCS
jgi:hypothetical protein